MTALTGRVALVAGGSRGVGKGVAEELAAQGAAVYVTGRTVGQSSFAVPCVPVPCDHRDDRRVESVVRRVLRERGRLDILANSVWGGYERIFAGGEHAWSNPFWKQPFWLWDSMFTAGVRAHYVASCVVARQMVEQRRGLIVNISYWAARKHIANVAYGVSKAATDKMTADMAHELRRFGVSVVSLYPGLVRTELVLQAASALDLGNSESPRFVGRAVAALAGDPDVAERSGSVVIAAECAREYGFKDLDGRLPRPLTLEEA